LGVSGAHMVQLVDDLEQRGLVARRRLETDRRAQVVDLLPAGRETVRRTVPLAGRIADDRLSPLSADEVRRLVALLQRLVTAP
jgi:DNA-binding MarR family transcriptional regulator